MITEYELSVSADGKIHNYAGKESARSIMTFIQVADERRDIISVTVEMSDGAIAIFLPVGKK